MPLTDETTVGWETLVLCEKPESAKRIAAALSPTGTARRRLVKGVPIFEIPDEGIVVCSALGHFYTVDAKHGSLRKHFPVLDLVWKPRHLIERNCSRQEVWLEVIKRLSSQAKNVVNACDYDIEGSLIGAMILKYSCAGADKKAKRMKFSTLASDDLKKSYQNLLPKLDFCTINAGMCRHEIDWLYGINLSRILTESSLRHNSHYQTISTGRVQAPTLRLIVEREEDITRFVPTQYWAIAADVSLNGKIFPVEYQGRIIEETKARKIVSDCASAIGRIFGDKSRALKYSPPPPFDLPSLQSEAYENLGLNPSQTLNLAERLYLKALISYPRTASQKLPPSIGYRHILGNLANNQKYHSEAEALLLRSVLYPANGRKNDLAHPAIFPTGNQPTKLGSKEWGLYDLIVRRFLCTFGDSATREIRSVKIDFAGHKFSITGVKTTNQGWTQFCTPHSRPKDMTLPDINVGQTVRLASIRTTCRSTKPPPRYNPNTLLKVMDRLQLGTKTTRAGIIETLYKRGYIRGNQIGATNLGASVVAILRRYCQAILDEKFSRDLESMMCGIEKRKSRRTTVVSKALTQLNMIISDLHSHEKEIGRDLSEAIERANSVQIELSVLCPRCGSNLRLLRGRKTGKRFLGCSMLLKGCDFSLPVPQRGSIHFLSKKCETCGFQLIHVRERHRSWTNCPSCYLRRVTSVSTIHHEPTSDHGVVGNV